MSNSISTYHTNPIIWLKIFPYVKEEDGIKRCIANLSLVSKNWYSMLYKPTVWQKEISLLNLSGESKASFIQVMKTLSSMQKTGNLVFQCIDNINFEIKNFSIKFFIATEDKEKILHDLVKQNFDCLGKLKYLYFAQKIFPSNTDTIINPLIDSLREFYLKTSEATSLMISCSKHTYEKHNQIHALLNEIEGEIDYKDQQGSTEESMESVEFEIPDEYITAIPNSEEEDENAETKSLNEKYLDVIQGELIETIWETKYTINQFNITLCEINLFDDRMSKL